MSVGSIAASGMQAHLAMFTAAAGNIADAGAANLADDIPATIVAQHGFTANARALSTEAELSRSLIDVLA